MYYIAQKRYHRIDGWRGYSIPAKAIAGGSYTGDWEDSPLAGAGLAGEISQFRREVLRPLGITARGIWGDSSNVFCMKRWLVVSDKDFPRAAEAASEWFAENDWKLRYLHDANLAQCLLKEAA